MSPGGKAMTLAVDCREFVPGRVTGIGRFLRGLLEEIARSRPHLTTVALAGPAAPIPVVAPHIRVHRLPQRLPLYWDQVLLPRALREVGATVFFSPYYKAPLAAPCPTVVTIHDLIPAPVSCLLPGTLAPSRRRLSHLGGAPGSPGGRRHHRFGAQQAGSGICAGASTRARARHPHRRRRGVSVGPCTRGCSLRSGAVRNLRPVPADHRQFPPAQESATAGRGAPGASRDPAPAVHPGAGRHGGTTRTCPISRAIEPGPSGSSPAWVHRARGSAALVRGRHCPGVSLAGRRLWPAGPRGHGLWDPRGVCPGRGPPRGGRRRRPVCGPHRCGRASPPGSDGSWKTSHCDATSALAGSRAPGCTTRARPRPAWWISWRRSPPGGRSVDPCAASPVSSDGRIGTPWCRWSGH